MTMPKFEPVAWLRDTLDGGLSTMTDCCTNVVKEIWLKANPKNVERYTAPLYTLDQLTKAYEAGKREQASELEAAMAEIARLKTVPMKYRRMAFNAQLQGEVARLEQENDQLRAQINVLRDAFQTFIDEHEECQDADEWMAELCSSEALHVAGEDLATTPEQSLAEYRNKVIEDCAVKADALANCEENTDGYRNGAAWCAEAIRAMKEKP